MNNKHIEWRRKKLEQQREEIESGQLNALREMLPNEVIKQACEESSYYFRTRLLSPLVIVMHMIAAGISREGSFQSAWHLAGQTGQSGSLAKGRKRLPLEVWLRIDKWMMQEIDQERLEQDLWHGHRVMGIDGTCISMSDEPELAQYFGRCGSRHTKSRFPIGRMTVVFDLKSLILAGHRLGAYRRGETELLKPMLGQELRVGDVLVGDRHFAGANHYAKYQMAGLEFITRAHQKLKVENLKVLHVWAQGDLLVEMKLKSEHRKANPQLPKKIKVRVIRMAAKINGRKETFWVVTSLLNAERYPAQEICEWLKKRWKVEGLIEELKIWLGADVLRSKTVEGIFKEMYARIIGLNLIHWLILKAARKHHQEAQRLSVSATLRLAAAQSLKMSTAPFWRLPLLYDELLEKIAHCRIPYRPDRWDPRMIKRNQNKYPILKITRSEWQTLNAMAA